jgi:hypothetical protein
MKTHLVLALGLAAALGVGAADAWAAKPRLYTVSLSGEIRSSLTHALVDTAAPPAGCVGSNTETRSFRASASFSPLPKPRPAVSSWLLFHAQLKSPRGSAASELTSSYAPDPEAPWTDPSTCAVPPERRSFRCYFAAEATRKSGTAYALRPQNGRYTLIYRPFASMVDCGDIYEASLFGNFGLDLRVSAVMALARGRSVVRSGMQAPLRHVDEWTPRETLRYRLEVTRVR